MNLNNFSRFLIILLSFQFIFSSIILAKIVEKNSIIFFKEENINGINFKHKFEIDNGIKKESFSINNLVVDQLEYEEAILEAEKEERRVERQKDDQIRQNFANIYYKTEIKLLQNELNFKLKELQNAFEKLNDKKLEPYLIFSKDGIENKEEFKDISSNFILKVKDFVIKQDKNKDLKKIQEYNNKVIEYTQKINNTFLSTINNAIDRSDDTQLLKELLSLVS